MISPEILAFYLESIFDLGFTGGYQNIDGDFVRSIRPMDIEPGNGFCIFFTRTPRHIEITFKLDHFAGSLARKMSDSSDYSRALFDEILHSANESGFSTHISINGENVEKMQGFSKPTWSSFDLDLIFRLPLNSKNFNIDDKIKKGALLCCSLIFTLLEVDQETKSQGELLPEGAKQRIEVNRYERNAVNRAACIAHYGPICQCCGFDFQDTFGEIGFGFIEVHHIVPVALMGGSYLIDPKNDLIPLCSNCHSMIHRKTPPYSISELKVIRGNAEKTNLESKNNSETFTS